MKKYFFAISLLAFTGCISVPKNETAKKSASGGVSCESNSESYPDPFKSVQLLDGSDQVERLFGSEQVKQLNEMKEFLEANPKIRVQVEGHVNFSGRLQDDLKSGEQISEYAKTYLVSHGIDTKRLSILSFGSEKPKILPAERPENLRVEFVVHY